MKIFFDTEFIEDGKTIELISIGMVREDGETYYAENIQCDLSRACAWVKENVIPHLEFTSAKTRSQIAKDIIEFVGSNPEFWAYYADYDWVTLCQLYGRMIDLPEGWPIFCMDLKQLVVSNNKVLPKQTFIEHNALNDALWLREAYMRINNEL